jgi:predicted nuclease of predicted toxin-antitoxin system
MSQTSNWKRATDAEIWNFALQASAIIITKDEDFARRTALGSAGPAVV